MSQTDQKSMTQKEVLQKYDKYIQTSIIDTYYMTCIKKCISNYNSELHEDEKICLARCVDRAHDYLVMEQNLINPYAKYQKK